MEDMLVMQVMAHFVPNISIWLQTKFFCLKLNSNLVVIKSNTLHSFKVHNYS